MLTKRQFDILEIMASSKEAVLSQRDIAKNMAVSVGTVNTVLSELSADGLVKNGQITAEGLLALEPYRVKRAVIIAAGFGSRMVPITLNTPKPLVRVDGVRIIDRIIDALHAADIQEIYVVRGYLATQFDDLLYKFPDIKFIENPAYNEGNNIGSILAAKDHLTEAYVLEADLLIYNPQIIKKYQYCSNFLTIPVQETDDWCFYVKNGYINKIAVGGENCHKMVGISYWTKTDGLQLATDVEKVFHSPGGKERYWDQVPLEYCKDHYKVMVRICQENDVVEIDTFNELKAIDKSYAI